MYEIHRRQRNAKGKSGLGRLIPAGRTWRLIRQMVPEFGSQAEIARCLGLKKPELRLDTRQVTVRTALRVLRLYRLTMVENLDAPQAETRRDEGLEPGQEAHAPTG
jgi:hypothetical protein